MGSRSLKMAIQKEKILSNGSSGNYWKITAIKVDKVQLTVQFHLSLFKDSSFRNSQPVDYNCKKYTFNFTKDELKEDITALGYIKIIEKAATMVPPFLGKAGDALIQYDSDLADGTSV